MVPEECHLMLTSLASTCRRARTHTHTNAPMHECKHAKVPLISTNLWHFPDSAGSGASEMPMTLVTVDLILQIATVRQTDIE